MGVDTQTQDFTVVGVGDMSGDVFGNGMLLSEHIRLVAAFDHRHIFLDPDPDASSSFAERRRIFHLPRSSWDDYDRSAISEGGGVYPRALKAIPISAQVAKRLRLPPDTQTRRQTTLHAPRSMTYLERRHRHLRQVEPRATSTSMTRQTTESVPTPPSSVAA
jgi:NAD-specific glutamate dehydrogenase